MAKSPSAWVGVREAAEHHGVNIKTMYEAVRRRQVPSRCIGNRILIPRSALARIDGGTGISTVTGSPSKEE